MNWVKAAEIGRGLRPYRAPRRKNGGCLVGPVFDAEQVCLDRPGPTPASWGFSRAFKVAYSRALAPEKQGVAGPMEGFGGD